jgi:hypothetical protein
MSGFPYRGGSFQGSFPGSLVEYLVVGERERVQGERGQKVRAR